MSKIKHGMREGEKEGFWYKAGYKVEHKVPR